MEIGPMRKALTLLANQLDARSPLSDVERAAVFSLRGSPQSVAAHRDFMRVSDTPRHCCLIVEGLVGRFAQLEDGSRQFISLHVPGDLVGLDTLMLPGAALHLHALSNSTIIKVPHEALRVITTEHANLTTAFWRHHAVEAAIVSQWLINIGRKNARGRIAHLLCEMLLRYKQTGQVTSSTFSFPATQEQIGEALGLTAVHVNRSIKTLRDDNLVRWTRSEVTVLDCHGLASVGEFTTGYLHLGAGRHGIDPIVELQAS